MAIIESPKSTGSFDRKQVIRLPKGLYGGMCSRYSLPKIYESKYGSKEKLTVGFVITHNRSNEPLPHYSGAFCFVANTLYDDGVKKSNLSGLLLALHGGKKTSQEIIDGPPIDYDTFIGQPVLLFIEPSEQPDRDGIFANRVTGVEPPDDAFRKAILPLWQQRKVEINEKTGLAYLASPAEEYENKSNSEPVASPLSDDDIPF